jgi:hypothetical protein
VELLYISPVIPAVTGNGLAMRAGMVLEGLAARHSVSLLVNRMYPPNGPVPEFFVRMCSRVAMSPDAYRGLPFEVVLVFRLASLPGARPFMNGAARHHLDIDEIESETHRRLAALCRSNGDTSLAFMEDHQAKVSAALEAEALPKFERIYVSSAIDREKLAAKELGGEICILHNSVRQPPAVPPRPPAGPFLFVGTLGYYPNEDACRYLRSEIVPRLPDFEFQIVGTGATDRLRRLLSHPAIRIVGEVPQVDAWYHSAGAALVPVRAGGGTRIKILEAFSFRRPVITTTAGMEGIDARHDESVLVADTPEEFAKACRRLRNEPGLGERLAGNAFSLVGRFYSAEATKRTIAAFRWSPNR